MKKCLKIHVIGSGQSSTYKTAAQKKAQTLGIEGTLQNSNDNDIIILARGEADNLDKFIDFLYHAVPKNNIEDVEAEPYTQEKDFRSVFRVIGD